MKYRTLSPTGDMIAGYEPSHLTGAQAVGAAIRSRILSFQGEWWEDRTLGIPFNVLVGRLDEEREQIADAYIRAQIMETYGVKEIIRYEKEMIGTQKKIYITVQTKEGELAETEVTI